MVLAKAFGAENVSVRAYGNSWQLETCASVTDEFWAELECHDLRCYSRMCEQLSNPKPIVSVKM
jgi:hypothetical protein